MAYFGLDIAQNSILGQGYVFKEIPGSGVIFVEYGLTQGFCNIFYRGLRGEPEVLRSHADYVHGPENIWIGDIFVHIEEWATKEATRQWHLRMRQERLRAARAVV